MFEQFYCQIKNAPRYRKSAPGEFVVERALKNKPYWRTPAMETQQKEKKLVLADWSAIGWTHEKIDEVRMAIRRLIDEGFSVYLWQNGRIVSLPKDQLSCLDDIDIRRAITPAYSDELFQAAMTQHAIPRDEVQILDDHWLRYAIHDLDQNTPRFLNVSDFASVAKEDRAKILDVIRQLRPPLTHFVHDEFSIKTNNCLSCLREAFPEIEIKTQYATIDSEVELNSLISDGSDSLAGVTLTLADLASLQEININQDLSLEQAETLFKAMPALKKLNVASPASKDTLEAVAMAIHSQSEHLPQLTDIRLTHTINYDEFNFITLDAEHFRTLLKNRHSLTLNGFKIDDTILAEGENLELNKLDIQHSQCTGNTFSQLLKLPKLKKLNTCSANVDLDGAPVLSGDEPFMFEEFSTRMLQPWACILINKSPNLKKLDTSYYDYYYEPSVPHDAMNGLYFPPGFFQQLTEGTWISRDTFGQAACLEAAPNLEKLTTASWDPNYEGELLKIKEITWYTSRQ